MVYQPTKCESCQHLDIQSGDWVPYGSTSAQLPDNWECEGDWTTHGDNPENVDELIQSLFLGEIRECPAFRELPKCEKHPDQFLDKKYGCSSCEEEAMCRTSGEEM